MRIHIFPDEIIMNIKIPHQYMRVFLLIDAVSLILVFLTRFFQTLGLFLAESHVALAVFYFLHI